MACHLKITWSEIYLILSTHFPEKAQLIIKKHNTISLKRCWTGLFYIVPFLTPERSTFFLLTIQKAGSPRANALSNKLSSFWAGGEGTEMRYTRSVIARRWEGCMTRHQHFGLGLAGLYLGFLISFIWFSASQRLKVGFRGMAEQHGLTCHIWLYCLCRSMSGGWHKSCWVSVLGVSWVVLAALSMPPFYPACQVATLSPGTNFALL